MIASRHTPALVGAGVLGVAGLVATALVLPPGLAVAAVVALSIGVGVLCGGVALGFWWVLDTAAAPEPGVHVEGAPVLLLRRVCAAAAEVRVHAVRRPEVGDLVGLSSEVVEEVFSVARAARVETGRRFDEDVDRLERAARVVEDVVRFLDSTPVTVVPARTELTTLLTRLRERPGHPDPDLEKSTVD
ncbi:hypothetical protein UO65_6585 [Actinokineospora spheciospongiae]|uniref:Uncharacterized protein n=1 Tax=Actinokineospora spheciospongiae TaxID=909613 RepID=W7INP2_9PSEU|nr:hypothetical protein [Actinokineospora spheciospongiae]EWC58131.1 hypothetical protein UO65_6585 [Actinokineospora spheciospongiae]